MEGYYDKKEAANVLGVTERSIQNYIRSGQLRRITRKNKTWVPKDDVTKLYESMEARTYPRQEALTSMGDRLRHLEQEVEVLKLSIGLKVHHKPRGKVELMLLRQTVMDITARGGWSNKELSEAATLVGSIQEEELITLYNELGATSWTPLVTLMQSMVQHVEAQHDYPMNGLRTLHGRLLQAKERLMGLVYATTHTEARPKALKAADVYRSLKMPLGILDQYVLGRLKDSWGPETVQK